MRVSVAAAMLSTLISFLDATSSPPALGCMTILEEKVFGRPSRVTSRYKISPSFAPILNPFEIFVGGLLSSDSSRIYNAPEVDMPVPDLLAFNTFHATLNSSCCKSFGGTK